MAIGGGVKFFSRSKCLFVDDTTISVTSGADGSRYCLDRNPISFWRSVGSNDLTTETIEITFDGSKTIDRLFLVDINWKAFTVKYFSGGSYVHFASVLGFGGSVTNITETVFSGDTAYYEFTPVTTTKIQIVITTTQTANQEKYASQIIATEELGTLVGFPNIKGTEIDRNLRKQEMLSGKQLVQKSEESFKVELDFQDYPSTSTYHADIDLMYALHGLEDNFLIWLCGGRRGSTYFGNQLKGYRPKDIFNVQLTSPLKPVYTRNGFKNQVNLSAKFEEAVD